MSTTLAGNPQPPATTADAPLFLRVGEAAKRIGLHRSTLWQRGIDSGLYRALETPVGSRYHREQVRCIEAALAGAISEEEAGRRWAGYLARLGMSAGNERRELVRRRAGAQS